MRKLNWLAGILFICSSIGCSSDDGNNLPSFDDRVEEAKRQLLNDLTSPAEGWIIQYQPTPGSGSFVMVLDFDPDGEVTIFSDVAENNGEFYEQTIPFRIDNSLGLELILETYGVFHFLFEQEQNSFGAEFEFIYVSKDGENMIFQSATDFTTVPTILTFEPAVASDKTNFATEISENLNEFKTDIPKALEANPSPIQQIIFEEENVSVFWRLNSATRTIRASFAAEGKTLEEVLSGNGSFLDIETGYTLLNNRLVLNEAINFVENNQFYEIKSIVFDELDPNGAPGFCTLSGDFVPSYTGIIPGVGDITMVGSLFDIVGAGFQPNPDVPYAVNIPFIFDNNGASLSAEGGLINEKFPEANGFVFYYGIQDALIPEYSVGFFLDNDEGTSDIFVREFLPTVTDGNRIAVNFTNNYYHSSGSTAQQEADLEEITNLLFDGMDQYAFDFPVEGLQVFKLFNPCNGFEIILVGN